MRPYIISHMMMSVDGRIDCPMVAQISGEEYYTALDSFGTSSKLSGRVTAALECSAVKEEMPGNSDAILGGESVHKETESEEYTIVVDTHGRKGETAVFDGCTWKADAPYRLKLQSIEQVPGTEVIWVRYLCS